MEQRYMYSGRHLAKRIINILSKWLGQLYEMDKLAFKIKTKKENEKH